MKRMYRLITAAMLIAALAACSLLAGCGKDEEKKSGEDSSGLLTGTYNIEIDVKDYGVIKATLDADVAPITVTNFVNLVKEGFYDGLTFHRIMTGFMIQGGDPSGNGMGGSDQTIKGEFASNGVENNISHERGVISMARSQEKDSASSQFFIMHADYPALDGEYAAFGKVTEGIEVVDAICEKVSVEDDNGTTLPENQPVINSIKLVD
ncbi:MAG: peptidylprolyl isomerase [Lachnospiraceae bacterium]|nr:peptidylprolyl isomerase [Lachnospiraceae bacterium]